jgi:hypothetical protein
MLRNVGDPLEVHEVDRDAMRQAIREVADFAKAQRTLRQAAAPK